MTDPAASPPSGPSFADDIAPILYKYRGEMAWRFDLANYADVKANAGLILSYIKWSPDNPPVMPPPPFPPFPQDFVAKFRAWIDNDYPQ